MPRLSILLAPAFALAIAPFAASDAAPLAADPAARGLDLFLHVPPAAAPRSTLPLQIEAFGFPTAVSLVPLAEATVAAAWDPEHLGPGIHVAPAGVKATTDASGRARLEVPVPDGDERELTLLVGVRSGSHERTRKVQVRRGPLHAVAVHVADTRVVPGSSVSTWVSVTDASSGAPAPEARVELSLVEGGLGRHTVMLTTDAGGTAMARVPIPFMDEPTWSWVVRGRSLGEAGRVTGEGEVKLRPREETPAAPVMRAFFDADTVLAGDHAAFTVRVRDASDQPVAALPVRWWAGPKGTEPPKDDEGWARFARAATTDAEGEIHATFDAPALVPHGVGTTLRLVARAAVEGHALEQSATVSVGVPTSAAELLPEAGSIIPGVSQRMLLRVYDGRGRPVAASFAVTGDGLATTVTTGESGEAELTWKPPPDVGALRNAGPCAGGVAAAVTVRPVGVVPALRPRTEPFDLCLRVDRDAEAMVSLERPIGRTGDRVHVRIVDVPRGAKAKEAGPATPFSLVLRSQEGQQSAGAWIEDGEKGGDVVLPAGAPGAWSILAASPSSGRGARVAGGSILVVPRVLPTLRAKVSGGRAAPGGAVDVDVDLTDGKGSGLPGSVAAVMVDLHGGASVAELDRIDVRRSVCDPLGIETDRCDRFVEGDPALDGLRRGILGARPPAPLSPESDPGGTARDAFTRTFGEVLHSLEGAVYEASGSAERLADVRRKGARGFTFNPELMTLVTAAMPSPPETPGGEPLSLADLLALDPQVSFDNVARRITRLKLFYVLQGVRAWKRERQLGPDEPIWKDPNALLRRLVREGRITEDLLLDPWGGTFQFVPASGPPVPFLTVVRGFELHSPGPDGRAGSADDVRDPFERVVRSGTPYARAMGEDRIVDARYDMEVGEPTVNGWQGLLEELTGKSLGGIGLGSVGTLGHGSGSGSGQGFGSGHGRLGGSHRSSAGLSTGVAFWTAPMRTDARGHLRFHVPLGDAETTWRIAFVGTPDGAPRATTSVDVPVSLPLSARVDAGVTWIEGDAVEAAVTLRNRTGKPVRASVSARASGAAQIADASAASRPVEVPPGGVAVTRVPVKAVTPGAADLEVIVRAPDLPDDVLHHTWQVLPAGEPTDLTRSQWVDGKATLEAALGDRPIGEKQAAAAVRLAGTPRLVLERGLERPIEAALEAMSPDRLGSREALADAVEVASRIGRWATAKQGDGSPLAARAKQIVGLARGRLAMFGTGGGPAPAWAVSNRLSVWIPPEKGERRKVECPPADAGEEKLLITLESEPVPESGSALSCWDAAVTSAVDAVSNGGDAVALARAFLALSDRPHRSALAATLIDRLREKVSLRPSGAVSLSAAQARDRSARAIVFAALLRGVNVGKPSPAPADRLAAWVGVQRDADGGYGSALATRAVVRALLDAGLEEQGTSRVTVIAGGQRREVEVPASARVEVPLDAAAVGVELEAQGPGLVARLERPVVRLWSQPPPPTESPLHLDVAWPGDASAGRKGLVSLTVRQSRGRPTTVDVRLPLPPGASLAEPVQGVRQVQGALLIRRSLDASGLATQIELPVRFVLAGRMTVPEARIQVAHEEVPRAVAPARPLVVR